MMSRQLNIAVFEDTVRMLNEHPTLIAAAGQSARRQIIVTEDAPLQPVPDRGVPAEVTVSRLRSFEAARQYPGKKVCVLNFASSTSPGGGVERGASAQEECLCRISTLYRCLKQWRMWEGFYAPHCRAKNPLHNDDCIYTPGVVVFKTDTDDPETMPEADWYTVDVITCAAPNLRSRPSNIMNPGEGDTPASVDNERLAAIHEKRLERILNVAAHQGAEAVILGAFGCGAFMNDPEVVAPAMNRVVQRYRNAFKHIEFAVYARSDRDVNYSAFRTHIEA